MHHKKDILYFEFVIKCDKIAIERRENPAGSAKGKKIAFRA